MPRFGPAEPAAVERGLAAAGLGHLGLRAARSSPYRTSFPIEELEVDGTPSSVAAKRLGWEDLEPAVQVAKPRFLHDPRREPFVYQRLLPLGPGGPPAFLGAGIEDDRPWLFIEWVEGRRLAEVGEREIWTEAARWLGGFHRTFIRQPVPDGGPLLVHDARFHRGFLARAREFTSVGPAGEEHLLGLARIADHHAEAVAALEAMPCTVLHGEFYASNVLIDTAPDPVRVAPIDWELAGPGPAALDLAALVSGWGPDEREGLRMAHAERAGESAVSDSELRLARLLVAVQWLGWAPREWQPPADQRRDWLAEAISIVEELEG